MGDGGDTETETGGRHVYFCDMAVFAGDILVFEEKDDNGQRDHLGQARSKHGGTTRKFSSVHDNIGYFAVNRNYYFDLDSVRIPYDEQTKKARTRSIFVGKKWLEVGHNPKDVWKISRLHRQHREREEHPTQKPMEMIERMVKASCPAGGTVLDPFAGSGTTAEVCEMHGRNSLVFEINPDYCRIIEDRVARRRGVSIW